ncbi:MAG: OB-fold domain-containing protein [Halobacteriales archaeon]|nr:OB-fold domain-containing protein [Halobacteriales archaeon]
MPAWFDELLDAVEAGEPFYMSCADCGASSLPPREVCPDCGSRDLSKQDLSTTATVESYTSIHVTIPAFSGETPYTIVVAGFDEDVRLTGQLVGDEVGMGDEVRVGENDEERYLTFETV